jgi:hypothetical protein
MGRLGEGMQSSSLNDLSTEVLKQQCTIEIVVTVRRPATASGEGACVLSASKGFDGQARLGTRHCKQLEAKSGTGGQICR